VEYITNFDHHSQNFPGVTCRIEKITFEKRLALLKEIRELARQYEFSAAGVSVGDRYEAAVIQHEINQRYWHYFVSAVSGLSIDGDEATAASVWSCGPDGLVQEVLEVIASQVFLSADEAKN
jgi:hypothetical protein